MRIGGTFEGAAHCKVQAEPIEMFRMWTRVRPTTDQGTMY